jgi:hypothetical protein
LFDALDSVGDRVDVDAQDPGRLLEAFVLAQVNGQGPDEADLVPGVVIDQRAQHILGELPQLVHVPDLQ